VLRGRPIRGGFVSDAPGWLNNRRNAICDGAVPRGWTHVSVGPFWGSAAHASKCLCSSLRILWNVGFLHEFQRKGFLQETFPGIEAVRALVKANA
jgi:hypothetical protein